MLPLAKRVDKPFGGVQLLLDKGDRVLVGFDVLLVFAVMVLSISRYSRLILSSGALRELSVSSSTPSLLAIRKSGTTCSVERCP